MQDGRTGSWNILIGYMQDGEINHDEFPLTTGVSHEINVYDK